MKIQILNQKHPTYKAECWRRYDALYRGGDAFRECIGDFLPKNPMEEAPTYALRSAHARYTNYVGPIVDWFAARLMAAPLTAVSSPATDSWYVDWKANVDGQGTDLEDFARARFVDACVKGRNWWLVRPRGDEPQDPPATRKAWEESGLGDIVLQQVDREHIFDWQVDEFGTLEWAIHHQTDRPRRSPTDDRNLVVERWTIYTADEIQVFEHAHREGEPVNDQLDLPGQVRPNRLKRVPLIGMGFDGARAVHAKHKGRSISLTASEIFGLWPLNRLADPQIAHFALEAGLEWSIARTCYSMPVFAGDDQSAPPAMGAGYYIKLGRGETFTWTAPPTAHLAVTEQRVASRRDELYRVANQMAQGVDNNAAAIGRSGESKRADQTSTDALLAVYGAMVVEAVQRTLEVVSAARGDALTWTVTGLDDFEGTDAQALTEQAVQSRTLDIPSPTFRREFDKRVALALLPDASEEVRVKIATEIDTNTPAESFSKPGADDDDEKAAEGEGDDEDEPASERGPGDADDEAKRPAPKDTMPAPRSRALGG